MTIKNGSERRTHGQSALSTVLTVGVLSHKHRWPATFSRALATETLDLAIRVYSEVLEDGHLDRLALVLDLLGSSVAVSTSNRVNSRDSNFAKEKRMREQEIAKKRNCGSLLLLFALLSHTSEKTKAKVKGRFTLNVVVGKGKFIGELLSAEDQTLLISGDTFASGDLRLDPTDSWISYPDFGTEEEEEE